MAWPMPDCGLSGATTTHFPKSFTASTRFIIPGAMIPSSLVIRMTGESLFFDLDIVIKGCKGTIILLPVAENRLPLLQFFKNQPCFLGLFRYLCSRLKIPIWQD